ncbi:hypothetical protein [Mycobacterium vicinigordonae]|uniref:Uncharacterized protein n=1 Tax=Mycobacterium vicinigordonae TaxID=1719132 RepID=A0A7D6EA38_9MYCO|nr:hypothetical protein [Mycobacterium vicinigordonae]QLL08405.1 hypothetical protein H0P51_05515 [Mycobacterium vicinigordonae]
MAQRWDVAGRLAEGVPAVEHTQSYVRASQCLGYEHPDLTAHPGQLHDWYDSEEGLDLQALDADCSQLRATDTVVIEALRLQRAQLAALAMAWTGPGADAAIAFLQRHCDAAAAVATEVRAAAQRCESLRDNLWQLVDAKVTTVTQIDDSTLAQRPVWLAATAAVTSGAGELKVARHVVTEQIKPYVDNVIRNEWVTVMRSTRLGVDACYDMVIDRMATAAPVIFEVPGDLGPPSPPRRPGAPGVFAAAAPLMPAELSGPDPGWIPAPGISATRVPSAAAAPAAPEVLSAPNPALASADSVAPVGDAAGVAGSAGGLGGAGETGRLGGIGGVVSRIIDEMGGLLSSGLGELGDASALNSPADNADAFDEGADHKHEPDSPEEPEEVDEPEMPPAAGLSGPTGAATGPQLRPPATPTQQPTVTQPPITQAPLNVPPVNVPPVVEPAPLGSTPCEIAADELPQAGR